MNGLLLRWLISALSLLLISYLVPGIEVEGFFYALVAAAFLGVLNAVVRPVLIVLTLPLTILTLGLFILILNSFMLVIVSAIIKGFHVHGFWAAFWGALLLSLISWLCSAFINSKGRVGYVEMRRDSDGRWE
ncbi:MAG: phage holin family protein [Deltaproteobacteria bacterium]|nr:phage holin family protein [Deltaproteobacteria bacterium]MBW2051584.1 phage holin family protein [Deltaproteobacteria bacterium]MBW2139871.1 phage holin family protein [Deltaproteobacteria bacterium]MBW2323811.1 phage holin family protein [Deltaproteobacteria bacterium]